MKSFYWMQHFSRIEGIDRLSKLVFTNVQGCICLSYFLGNEKKYLTVIRSNEDFLLYSLDGVNLGRFNENSKEWDTLNFSFCKYMVAKGLDYDKIFCLCRDKGLYK